MYSIIRLLRRLLGLVTVGKLNLLLCFRVYNFSRIKILITPNSIYLKKEVIR
jgi:hypothetical protein